MRSDRSTTMRAERAALDRCDLFQPLSGSERAALFAHARPHKYAANESIFLMGSPGDDMVAVVSGTIRISVPSPDGKEIVLAILGPGEICGEIALLDGKERTADANAATECSVVVLERRDVLAFLAKYPDTWTKLIGVFCARMRAMDHQLSEFAMTPMPVRLAKALLRLANPGGHAHDGGALESIRLTRSGCDRFGRLGQYRCAHRAEGRRRQPSGTARSSKSARLVITIRRSEIRTQPLRCQTRRCLFTLSRVAPITLPSSRWVRRMDSRAPPSCAGPPGFANRSKAL